MLLLAELHQSSTLPHSPMAAGASCFQGRSSEPRIPVERERERERERLEETGERREEYSVSVGLDGFIAGRRHLNVFIRYLFFGWGRMTLS
jgi:hypothetical protein